MTPIAYQPPFDLSEIVNNLVTEDDEPVDNVLTEKQERLLTRTLYSSWTPPPDEDNPTEPRLFWASANVGVFFSVRQPPLVPDVFLSLDVTAPADMHAATGRSYFVWEYGKVPDVVIEVVSLHEGGELTRKLREYARMGVHYYVVFDPLQRSSSDVLRVYEPGLQRRYYLRNDYELPEVGLSLTLWHGTFEGTNYHQWLRWCDADGNLILTGEERATLEGQRANQAESRVNQAEDRATQAEDRAARLAAQLRALGLDPEEG